MKLYKYLSIAALTCLPLTGCSDFLEADNKSAANVDGDSFLSGDPSAFRPVMYDSFRFLPMRLHCMRKQLTCILSLLW